ncbi:MAG: TetR/AcrR family transcriptional regulator [Thermodesulfobacteriota bacterium]|nr:TetR/AcrR family transcriptional regulator [Thermodesulfobacteriota bacterium]
MPKIVDHQKFKEELLLKCFELFTSRGYDTVTMREIANSLDVSTGLLYHYFPDKQTMLQNMFEVIAIREIDQLTQVAYQTDDVMERVDIFFNYFKERETFYKGILLLLLDFSKHCTSEENISFMKNYAGIMAERIGEGVGTTDRHFGFLVLSFLVGLFYLRLIVPHTIDLNALTDIARQMFNLAGGQALLLKFAN